MKEAMEIRLVYPEVGYRGGGSVVRVTGENLLFPDVRCKFGPAYGPAAFVSSSLLLCETGHEAATVALELATAATTATEPLVRPNFVFDELPVVTGASFVGGFTEVGNVVALAGYFFSEMHDMMCRFGTIGWVAGEWIARRRVPMHRAGTRAGVCERRRWHQGRLRAEAARAADALRVLRDPGTDHRHRERRRVR